MTPTVTPEQNLELGAPPGMAGCDPMRVEVRQTPEGYPVLVSTWDLTDDERLQIGAGGRVELWVFGSEHPPVAMQVID